MLRDILKNKKIKAIVITFLFASALMIGLAIWSVVRQQQEANKKPEIDPASGEVIGPPTGGNLPEYAVPYIGFEKFVNNGANFNMYKEFQSVVRQYQLKVNGNNYNTYYKRVSMYKDSYSAKTDPKTNIITHRFKIELDTNKKTLWVKIESFTPFRYKFYFYDTDKEENPVLEYNYCDPAVCKEDTTNVKPITD